jgi:hypothetical protein
MKPASSGWTNSHLAILVSFGPLFATLETVCGQLQCVYTLQYFPFPTILLDLRDMKPLAYAICHINMLKEQVS